jgi:prepilin-type N-terminal cleavage/methylation domain-containing protein
MNFWYNDDATLPIFPGAELKGTASQAARQQRCNVFATPCSRAIAIIQLHKHLVQRNSAHFHHGFTIVEMVIALVVAGVLGAIGIFAISGYTSDQKVATSAQTLRDLSDAVLAFKNTVGAYPSLLSHLTRPITGSDKTACPATSYTTTATTGNVAKWASGAPYYPRTISTTGLPVAIGTVNDALVRNPTTAGVGFLQIQVPNVSLNDANGVNRIIDGPNDTNGATNLNTTGAVQWSASSTAGVTLNYLIPVGGSC